MWPVGGRPTWLIFVAVALHATIVEHCSVRLSYCALQRNVLTALLLVRHEEAHVRTVC